MATRNGTERRTNDRGNERRNGTLALSMRHLENAERIVALLAFVPYVTTETEAVERETEAAKLTEENTLLFSFVMG